MVLIRQIKATLAFGSTASHSLYYEVWYAYLTPCLPHTAFKKEDGINILGNVFMHV